jgi:hypothetical protein
MRTTITISLAEQEALMTSLQANPSVANQRMLKLLQLPNLAEQENHPIKLMKDTII